MEDLNLDEIILEQLHAAKRTAKLYRRLEKIIQVKCEELEYGKEANKLRQHFFESMIHNKDILHKKPKRKKENLDVLSKNPVYEMYRYSFMLTSLSYKIFVDSMNNYFNYFKKR